jgi:hypothetical protein
MADVVRLIKFSAASIIFPKFQNYDYLWPMSLAKLSYKEYLLSRNYVVYCRKSLSKTDIQDFIRPDHPRPDGGNAAVPYNITIPV